jgi:hypothetical protein
LNGLSVSPVRSRGIFSTRSLMMLRWISSVPPAIGRAASSRPITTRRWAAYRHFEGRGHFGKVVITHG